MPNIILVDDEKMLLYVGRIAQEKSLDMIIRAFKSIKDEKLKIKFVVVGGGPQLDELKELATELDLNDYITFIGKVPAADYTFISSTAVEEDHFIGLAIDDVNESDKTEARIASWTKQIATEMN